MPINVSRCRNTRWFDIYALMISCKLTNQGIYPPYICVKFDYLTSFSHILLCTCVLDLHLGTCTWLLIDRWHKQISNWLQYRSHYRLWIRLIHLPLYCTRWFQVRRGVMARRCYLGKNISDIGCKQASEEAKRDGTLYIHIGGVKMYRVIKAWPFWITESATSLLFFIYNTYIMNTQLVYALIAFMISLVLYRPFATRLDHVRYTTFCLLAFVAPMSSQLLYTAPFYGIDISDHYSNYTIDQFSSTGVLGTTQYHNHESHHLFQNGLLQDSMILALLTGTTITICGILSRWDFPILYVKPESHYMIDIAYRHVPSICLVIAAFIHRYVYYILCCRFCYIELALL